jgi:translation elongation factor EF-1beta
VTSLTDFELTKSESEPYGFGVQQIHIGVAGEKQMDFSAAVRTIKKTKSVESK